MGTTHLLGRHVELGAKLTSFGGWEMPLQYRTGVLAEHRAVREAVGLFDVSHLGSIWIEGPVAAGWLNRMFTNDLAKAPPGRAQYTLLLTPEGGVVDDIIVWHLPDGCWVIPNAANTDAVMAALFDQAVPPDVIGADRSTEMAILALQGPRAQEVAASAGLPFPDRFDVLSLDEREGAAAGTGYTGESGCEYMVPGEEATEVWDLVVSAGESAGILPCGLGARDTLRLEMGYPLHGHEMDDTVSPFEAGLGWVVDLEKGPFRGRDAVADGPQGASRVLVGIEMRDRAIPRQGCAVSLAGDGLGAVTSGNFSPTLGKGIALARVDATAHLQPGTPVEVNIRGAMASGIIAKPPFVKKR
jgi:aminomethyltransferase